MKTFEDDENVLCDGYMTLHFSAHRVNYIAHLKPNKTKQKYDVWGPRME